MSLKRIHLQLMRANKIKMSEMRAAARLQQAMRRSFFLFFRTNRQYLFGQKLLSDEKTGFSGCFVYALSFYFRKDGVKYLSGRLSRHHIQLIAKPRLSRQLYEHIKNASAFLPRRELLPFMYLTTYVTSIARCRIEIRRNLYGQFRHKEARRYRPCGPVNY